MERKFYLSIIFLLFIGINIAQAQVRFGVKGGIDIIDHKIDTDILRVSNRLGYQVGATVEMLIPAVAFGTEVSVLYGRKEYKVEDKIVEASISDYDYISIPLTIKKRFGITSFLGIFLSAGGFANVKIEGGNLSIDDVVDKYKSKQFEAGWSAGAGVKLFDHFDVGLYYRNALTTRYADISPEWEKLNDKYAKSWSVGLTCFF